MEVIEVVLHHLWMEIYINSMELDCLHPLKLVEALIWGLRRIRHVLSLNFDLATDWSFIRATEWHGKTLKDDPQVMKSIITHDEFELMVFRKPLFISIY